MRAWMTLAVAVARSRSVAESEMNQIRPWDLVRYLCIYVLSSENYAYVIIYVRGGRMKE